jgi:hypothetical protein
MHAILVEALAGFRKKWKTDPAHAAPVRLSGKILLHFMMHVPGQSAVKASAERRRPAARAVPER